MLELVKYGFWNFNVDNSGHASGLVGQITHCTFEGATFYTRENVNAIPTFLISSNERWGEKAGNKPRKERQSLELYVPNPDKWAQIVEVVKAADPLKRPVLKNREFNQKWIDNFSKNTTWTWSKTHTKNKKYV